jgi:hypothetical protein
MRCCLFDCVKRTVQVDFDSVPPIIWGQLVTGGLDAIDQIVERLLQLNSDEPTLQVDHNPIDHLFQYITLTLTW